MDSPSSQTFRLLVIVHNDQQSTRKKDEPMNTQILEEKKIIVRLGIDTSKSVFQLHGVNKFDKTILRKKLSRANFLIFMANLAHCLIGIEACGSSHHWARELEKMGHTVKLMPAQHVKAYRTKQKNDAHDAEAICEAVSRPRMSFVPIKTVEQQDIQAHHRIRQEIIKSRTALVNQTRGLLGEYGIIAPQGIEKLRAAIPLILEDADNQLSTLMRAQLSDLYKALCELDERLAKVTKLIEQIASTNEVCRKLIKVFGIGPIGATAFYAAIGSGKQFRCGRDAAAWLGLVPGQHSTGGKAVLLGISKKGNRYIRTIFIHGARSVVSHAQRKNTPLSKWILELVARRGKNRAAVAVANKMARVAWAVMQNGQEYKEAV
jgi:transposase